MNNKRYKFLENSLLELMEKNIISEEQLLNAKDYFKRDEKNKTSIITIFTSIGVLLIALSIITLFAMNWVSIGKGMKVIISFVPLIITAIMMFFYIKNGNEKLKLYTSIFAPISIIATNSLIGQIFHIQMEIYEVFFISLLMFLPIAFVLKNYLSIAIYCVGTLTYVVNIPDTWIEVLNVLIISAPIFIYNYFCYVKDKANHKNTLMYIANVIVLTSIIFKMEIIRPESIFIYTYLIYLITKILFGRKNIFSRLLKTAILICMFVFCINDTAIQIEFFWDSLVIALLAIACIYAKKLYKEPREWFNITFIVLIQYCNMPDEISYIVISLLMLTFGIYKIIFGTKNGVYKETKKGIWAIMILVLIRFMSSDLSFSEKSILFLISGVIFIVTANVMKKKIGGGNNDENGN